MKTASFLSTIFFALLTICSGISLADQHGYNAKIYGIVESMPLNGTVGTWIIGGKKINVTNLTEISTKHGRPATGLHVEVKGQQNNGIFNAYKIKVEEERQGQSGLSHAKFYGMVEKLPLDGLYGIWTINGREILVTESTRIKEKYGIVAVGSQVEVEGNFQGNTFTVYELEVKSNQGRIAAPNHNILFAGDIEKMPQGKYEGQWVVAGYRVEVSNKTIIDETAGKAVKGGQARIKGIRSGDMIMASELKTTTKQQ